MIKIKSAYFHFVLFKEIEYFDSDQILKKLNKIGKIVIFLFQSNTKDFSFSKSIIFLHYNFLPIYRPIFFHVPFIER